MKTKIFYLFILMSSLGIFSSLFAEKENETGAPVALGARQELSGILSYPDTDRPPKHNVNSKSLDKSDVISVANACVGTGTTSVEYPFYSFYSDSRTDMLYLASEIIAGGGTAGSIQSLGFNVSTASSQVLNGFKIKIQATSSTSISGFTSSGWTTVYDGIYTVPGPGWQYITFQTPFAWNGTSNLLIEICFNNSNFLSNSIIKATPSLGTVVHQHDDLATGDGCTDLTNVGGVYSARPNICFTINAVGITPVGSFIPDKFFLGQNYPNPFNPVTNIKFDIPAQDLVKLILYDILGHEVNILVNEVKSAGSYIVDFDASELPSGVYFYRLESGNFVDAKRMLLIK
jgi:hypothetical protein